MKVTLYMAMSLNNMIARENNEEDFISHDSWTAWLTCIRKHGCMIWGRRTHQVVKTWDKQYLEDIKGIKVVIVSSNENYDVGDQFELASSPHKALENVQSQGFSSAVLTGGSILNSSFAKLNLINEVIVCIEPVLIGAGIPLFNPEKFDLNLKLLDVDKVSNRLIELRYEVVKNAK